MSKILEKILQLKTEIAKHDEAYHGNDNPIISDAEYDELRKKLAEYQQNYPQFFSAEEEKIGAKSLDIFNKIKHSKPMLSLANGFSEESIIDFIERTSPKLINRKLLENIIKAGYQIMINTDIRVGHLKQLVI